jgi:chromosome segregation ATPase
MSKRAKMTADKARERITKLEESIASRESKLESLKARLGRTSSPDEKLVAARSRLERRLRLEQEQVQKLKRLLSRHSNSSHKESSDYFGEDIEDLHRSFEEVRQDLSHVKSRLESADLPRDLPSRLTAFEERIKRTEDVSSDLYGQMLNFENALDQERQTVRRLSRKIREQDQNMDALREAVEDSVVATVDMVQRLEELEEGNADGEGDETDDNTTELKTQVEALQAQLEEMESRLLATSNNSEEILLEALDDFDTRLEGVEQTAKDNSEAVRFTSEELAAVSVEIAAVPSQPVPEPTLELTPEEMLGFVPELAPEPEAPAEQPQVTRTAAVFAAGCSGTRLKTKWRPANFQTKKSPRFP